VDSWPGNVGSVFNQHMVHQPVEKINGNETKPNPVCSYILTSTSLESSGDSEVQNQLFKNRKQNILKNIYFLGIILVTDALVSTEHYLHLLSSWKNGTNSSNLFPNVIKF